MKAKKYSEGRLRVDRGDGLDDSVSGEGVGEREDLDRAEVDVEEAGSPVQFALLLEADDLAGERRADEDDVAVDAHVSRPVHAAGDPIGGIRRDRLAASSHDSRSDLLPWITAAMQTGTLT